MFNRAAFKNQKKVSDIVDEAVKRSRQSGDVTFATSTTSTGGTATVSPALDGDFTYPDEDGNTIRPFMLDVDAMDDPTARLA